jgi:phosphoglycolate phosphatase
VQKYRLILFDFDGTLADTLPWFRSVFHIVGEKHGFRKLDQGDHEKLRERDSKEILKMLGVPFWKVPMIANEMRGLMASRIRETKLFPGTSALLKNLAAKGARLGIVSSNSFENVSQILGAENMLRIQYHECGVSMFGKASKLKKVLRSSKTPPAQAIYIGDELRDLVAARAARVPFGAVSWGYNSPEALKKQCPDEMFLSMEEIVEKVC